MKLLVIGQTVEDHYMKNGEEVTAPGGIYYAASALKQIKAAGDEIILCTSIEEKNYSLYSEVYDHFDKQYLQRVGSVPRVWLTINPASERSERYHNINASLNTDFDLSSFDGILLNMVTGFDISLQQLKDFRKRFKGLIYLDVHTLSRGLDENNNRNFRIIPHFDQWAECVDIIQVNTNELYTLSDLKEEQQIKKWLFEAGVKSVIVTLDEKGSKYYFNDRTEIASVFQSAIKIDVKNKIGCGDVFGAAFFYKYMKTMELHTALQFANSAAGCIASYNNVSMIKNLKNDIDRQLN